MAELDYQEALKLGKREYKACVSQGRFPYLPVLDEIIANEGVLSEQKLGLQQIPAELVVGTSTFGRTYSFAANFMPILGSNTEFAMKWANLADAQINEGIREPIICYEYMNRYYVVEGNKRVSVLKYFGADSILAEVTRKIPKKTDDWDVKLYYEYMDFYRITGINYLEFTRAGAAAELLHLLGKEEIWTDEERLIFKSVWSRFSKAYKFHGGDKLPITIGDAIIAFLQVFTYDEMINMSEAEYNSNVIKLWNEFVVLKEKHRVGLVMDPVESHVNKPNGILKFFLPQTVNKRFKVAFLYTKSPEDSDWIYSHELGRNYLEDTFPEQIETIRVDNVAAENIEDVLENVIKEGAKIIFGVSPEMMKPSLKVAIAHPEVKILNCSLNTPHKYIRTYYGRMYEAKFLSGVIAGALAENDKIAYIADYPIYGMIANINAFALGAQLTNPRAKVYLEWSTKKGYDREKFLWDNDLRVVSDQDMITPTSASRQFGLYVNKDWETHNLVMPLWNWGIFYEKMIQSILVGSYQEEEESGSKALNYWWGISAGVIDLIVSKNVPSGVKRLVEHLKCDIANADIVPFYGVITDQDGKKHNAPEKAMAPEDIMNMDYLVENVIGSIPSLAEVIDEAKKVISLKGIDETKDKTKKNEKDK